MDKILLLFDIDGTLINSCYKNQPKKSHGHYLLKALAQVFLGDVEKVTQINIEGLHMPGGTDGSITLDTLYHNNLIPDAKDKTQPSEDVVSRIDYACNIISPKMLSSDIRMGKFVTQMCPNINQLLEKLAADDRFILGLLTGNYAVCAKLKLESAGVDIRHFMINPEAYVAKNLSAAASDDDVKSKSSSSNASSNCDNSAEEANSASVSNRKPSYNLNYDVDPRNETEISFRGSFGSDNFIRRKLPPVAIQRHVEMYKQEVSVDANQEDDSKLQTRVKAVIIGDTPKDIDCAKFNNLKSVGVATGYYTSRQLEDVGADLVFENFENIEDFIEKVVGMYA